MEQRASETSMDNNYGIGIIPDDGSATYFGIVPQVKAITSSYNRAQMATRVFWNKFTEAGRPYPALSEDTDKLRTYYSNCTTKIDDLDTDALWPSECIFTQKLRDNLENSWNTLIDILIDAGPIP